MDVTILSPPAVAESSGATSKKHTKARQISHSYQEQRVVRKSVLSAAAPGICAGRGGDTSDSHRNWDAISASPDRAKVSVHPPTARADTCAALRPPYQPRHHFLSTASDMGGAYRLQLFRSQLQKGRKKGPHESSSHPDSSSEAPSKAPYGGTSWEPSRILLNDYLK